MNLDGEVIGINAMKVTPGISFAIPIDYAKNFLKKSDDRRKGKPTPTGVYDEPGKKRYLGITMLTLTAEILSDLQHYTGNISPNVRHGVLIWRVIFGSPAHIGGLKTGDIITHANGEAVTSAKSIYKVLEKPGPVNLTVVRSGVVVNLKIDPEDSS